MLSRRILQALVFTAATIVLFAFGALAYQLARVRISEAISNKVDRLVLRPPEGTPKLQWAVLVYWTHNLHGASMPQVYASYSSLRELDRFLDASIANGPTRETIDRLWARYSAISESGSQYGDKFMPVRDSIVESIAAEGDDFSDARSYLDFLESVRLSSRN